jgi:maltodextrin utilization protein YvdJ
MAIYGLSNMLAPFSDVCAIGGMCGAIFAFVFSCIPVFTKGVEVFDTTSTKLGNEIIVQSLGLPTQIVNDIKFIDQPLVIVKKVDVNMYGIGETVTYRVQLKNVEKN